jgi:predicted aspartyl protease
MMSIKSNKRPTVARSAKFRLFENFSDRHLLRNVLMASWLAFSFSDNAIGAETAHCRFVKFATLPVKTQGASPYIEGSVNGQAMQVLVDTGAQETALTRAMADRAHLTLGHTGIVALGISGESERYHALVDEVTFGPVRWKHANLPVVGQLAGQTDLDALLGADFLFQSDVEMVLAEKELRFFHPDGCGDAFLAYWDENAAVVQATVITPNDQRQLIQVQIDGKPFKALIDSGADQSAIDEEAAARVGVTRPTGDRLRQHDVGGIGSHAIQVWTGKFKVLEIGSELIRNVQIDVMDMTGAARADSPDWSKTRLENDADVLLGADFLRAHRVLFAVSQHRVYFSYLGGPVFSRRPR